MDKEQYKEIIKLYNAFSEAMKQVELEFSSEFFIPSLNEMRYAMRALIALVSYDVLEEYTNKDVQTKKDQAFTRCKHALLCGYHDLLDIAVGVAKHDLDESITNFGLENVIKAFPNYNNFGRFLDDLSNQIIGTRGFYNESLDKEQYSRVAVYERLLTQDSLDNLTTQYRDFKYSLKTASELAEKAKKKTVFNSLGIVAGIVGVIIGIIAYFL